MIEHKAEVVYWATDLGCMTVEALCESGTNEVSSGCRAVDE